MKSFYFVAVLFVSFVLFTACGGESCEENCIEPVDEISTTDENEVVDDTTDEDEVALVDDPGQLAEKVLLRLSAAEPERSRFLADLMFVQHDQVVTKVIELELLQGRNNLLAVVPLVEDAKSQHEYRVVGVHRLHAMITAFVHINHEIAEPANRRFAGYIVICIRRLVAEQGELLGRCAFGGRISGQAGSGWHGWLLFHSWPEKAWCRRDFFRSSRAESFCW